MLSYPSSQSFVQRTFPPIIGSLTSQSVELICQKNNLSFVELLRPFCSLQLEHRLKDPSGSDHYIKHLQICIQDVNERPPQPAVARKLLNGAVACSECDVTRAISAGGRAVDIPTDCNWFRAWTEAFLQVQFPSEHEFTKHLLGCVLVTSSSDPPETLQNLLQNLQQMQATAPARLPKWFCPAIFKFFVLIHDSRDADKTKALNFFNSLKTSYGNDNCYFLELNSRETKDSSAQDHWSYCVNRRMQEFGSSGTSSSPRTPAELGGIGGMPAATGGSADVNVRSADGNQDNTDTSPSLLLHPLSPDLHGNHFSIANDKHGVPVVNANVWSECSGNRQFGQCLADTEVEAIRNLVRSLVINALLPHVEKQIYILNDFVSNKKGMSRSLLSATKRLFGGSKPGTPGSTPANSVIYAYDAPELQLRRLGDLYFMFTNYSLAFQTYYTAKRELGADQAWLYYAGALEMAALSAFLTQEPLRKAVEYMEESIVTYLNSCKMPQFATRATLLSVECLKEKLMFGEAASQLIRMTSEESDLRSALLLEQASYCFLMSTKPKMYRKYALHMVLAGHRFFKSGQKSHALRCYRQAFQVYEGKGWGLADDHIHYTTGRLAGHLGLLGEGCAALSRLLLSNSRQTPEQQKNYLLEFLNMHQQWERDEGRRVSRIALPAIEPNSARVLTVPMSPGAFEPDSVQEAVRWAKMEELAVTESQSAPMIFRPSLHLYSSSSLNVNEPILAVNEWVTVEVCIRNPLHIPISLSEFRLLWTYTSTDGRTVNNEQPTTFSESIARTQSIQLLLAGQEVTKVAMAVSPQCPGKLALTGVAYFLSPALVESSPVLADSPHPRVAIVQDLIVRGPKLKPRNDKPNEEMYSDDKRLSIIVVPSAPLIAVTYEKSAPMVNSIENYSDGSSPKEPISTINGDVLCGEVDLMSLVVENIGNAPLSTLYIVTDAGDNVSLRTQLQRSRKIVVDTSAQDGNEGVSYLVIKVAMSSLKPGEKLTLPFWYRAPDHRGTSQLSLLFHYTNPSNSLPRHRVSRFTRELQIHDALQVTIMGTASPQYPSTCATDAMNLCVSARNLNAAHNSTVTTQLSLCQMLVASRLWALQGPALSPKDVTLRSQESAHFLAKACMVFNEDCNMSEVSVSKSSKSELCQMTKDYVLRKFTSDSDSGMLIGLFWEGKITCFKSSTTREARGLALLPLSDEGVLASTPLSASVQDVPDNPFLLTIFGPDRREKATKKPESAELARAVSFSITHVDTIYHSFTSNRVCCVDVNVSLWNSSSQTLKIAVNSTEVPTRSPVLRTQLYTPHASVGFAWAGRARAILEVPERCSSSVTLRATMTTPGVYDIASRVTVAVVTDTGLVPLPAASETPVVILPS